MYTHMCMYTDICIDVHMLCCRVLICSKCVVVSVIQDRINSLPLSGPHRLSSNDLLCSILWHVSCLVRDRHDSSGTFYLPFDLRQMHVPDAYFGNAHSMLSVVGKSCRISSSYGLRNDTNFIEKPVSNVKPMQRSKKHRTRSLTLPYSGLVLLR